MAGTFEYYPTNEERNKNSYFLVATLRHVFEKLYWMYYIHLPYYLMESQDAFVLHLFFLTLFSLCIYAVFSYLPHTLVVWFTRSYYYLTGDDFKKVLIHYGFNA
ncbi:TSC3 [Cyberlindnera jadinii]|uniref:TSC3 protein n=1 Tax=Cyberlindnera jadinii (strain ATCC 18201 / CBS 1600 / BCRC 20928 / JCM 3617 / NBRC 0987 / NRRL Y-1542) TaxID=983966 RepID=A0A0H5C4H7_CYBJN|nr:TSC3 [Cyberlindnera jadinii]